MSNSMPLALIIGWSIFFGFVNTHQRHATNFQGASKWYHRMLYASVILGTLTGLGLLIFYFTRVSWYWPFVLFIVGFIAGGLFFGFIDRIFGDLNMSLVSFIGWPISAVWVFKIMRNLLP